MSRKYKVSINKRRLNHRHLRFNSKEKTPQSIPIPISTKPNRETFLVKWVSSQEHLIYLWRLILVNSLFKVKYLKEDTVLSIKAYGGKQQLLLKCLKSNQKMESKTFSVSALRWRP
jgi:hypothetical protein